MWGFRFRVWGLGFRVLRFRILGFRVILGGLGFKDIEGFRV